MATSITGEAISTTYKQLLHIDGGPTLDEKTVYSGAGVATALKLGTESASLSGSVKIDVPQDNNISLTDFIYFADNENGQKLRKIPVSVFFNAIQNFLSGG